MTIKMKKIIFFSSLLITLILCSCKREDDINVIFDGKTWYINGVTVNNKDANQEDMTKLYQSGKDYYRIAFSSNTFIATMSEGIVFTGKWSANGKTQEVSMSIDDKPSAATTLDNTIISLIEKTKSYEGDSHVLLLKKDKNNFIRMCEKR